VPTDDPDCPFCQIVRQEDADAREVYRDDHVVAFFPTEPATLGHTLIIPRNHIPDIWALDDETATNLARVTLDISQAVRTAIQPHGLNIIQSNGEAATQTVPHVHVHVVPRWQDDAIGRIWPPETDYSEQQKDDAWEQLRIECGEIRSHAGDLLESPGPATVVDGDNHRKHIELIQAIVTRMSSASSAAKGWLLPVVTATYGYAIVKDARSVALLGIAAVLLFAFLDANYLKHEKAYRRLYRTVVRNPQKDWQFSLDPTDAEEPHGQECCCKRPLSFVGRWIPGWSVWLSWAIAPFYGAFVVVGLFIYCHAASPTPTPPPPPATHATPH
jgi:ATP adenylyltransferase